jgi:hypothetical protein
MEYNTQREHLIISEYGRNVQNMVKQLDNLDDKKERTAAANAIIGVMATVNGLNTEIADHKQRLLNHLFFIAGKDLDLDIAYEKPQFEKPNEDLVQLSYPMGNIKFRHYGGLVERFIKVANDVESEEEKEKIASMIANFMKIAANNFNHSAISDEDILNDLNKLSNGQLTLSTDTVLNKAKQNFNRNKAKKNQPKKNNFHKKRNF